MSWFEGSGGTQSASAKALIRDLEEFDDLGTATRQIAVTSASGRRIVPGFVNEFWTARQRQAHSLHEVSYRACFKPQLPRFFIERLSGPGDTVHDPFLGRGTTLIEAALLGRRPSGSDINPLSDVLVRPRLEPPRLEAVAERLAEIDWSSDEAAPEGFEAFYHAETLAEILALRRRLLEQPLDAVDRWIRMVAVNRLTGHSPGFFSVYTMPPNQAVSIEAQRRINAKRDQEPPRRDVPDLILRKSRALLKDVDEEQRALLAEHGRDADVWIGDCTTGQLGAAESVDLVVTSPPFLDVVQYATDNWLRCWFCGIDPAAVELTMARRIEDWNRSITSSLKSLHSMLRHEGAVAFEVGEVRGGAVRLDEHVIDCGLEAGFDPVCVVIHDQQFTKTANCWGIENNRRGTNTNRIVILQKNEANFARADA